MEIRQLQNQIRRGQADQWIVLPRSDELPEAHREALVRLAVLNDVPVEVVQHSEELAQLGGVGCLLRYEIRSMAAAKPAEQAA